MTQSQSSAIKFSYCVLFFYHPKSVIAKSREEGTSSPTFTPRGQGTVVFVPKLCHNTKSIFYHQVQIFYAFLPPEVSDNKPGVDVENKPLNNLVAILQ